MRMRMGIPMLMGMGNLMRFIAMRRPALLRQHIHLGPGNAATHRLACLKPRTHLQALSRLLQHLQRHARIHHGAQKHVAADPGKAIQIPNAHRM